MKSPIRYTPMIANECLAINLGLEPLELFSYKTAKEHIANLKMKAYNLKNSKLESKTEEMNSEASLINTIKEMSHKFIDIQVNHKYKIKNYDGIESNLMFTDSVIKDLTKSRMPMAAKDSLVSSAFRGYVRNLDAQGIKRVSSFHVHFVEVKNIGKKSGKLRLFGCHSHGVTILYFLGTEFASSNDQQIEKIRKICHKSQ